MRHSLSSGGASMRRRPRRRSCSRLTTSTSRATSLSCSPATLSGSLAEFDAPEVTLSCPVDVELAAQSIVALHDEGLPVVGASFGANDPAAATAPMDWGVLIPLWVMGGRSEPPVPTVVVSPARDRPIRRAR